MCVVCVCVYKKVCVRACVCVRAFVCVCVREREREKGVGGWVRGDGLCETQREKIMDCKFAYFDYLRVK